MSVGSVDEELEMSTPSSAVSGIDKADTGTRGHHWELLPIGTSCIETGIPCRMYSLAYLAQGVGEGGGGMINPLRESHWNPYI
jgi:hypothetical protein